jgi:NAD(P)-dependent dehydrogenase (short-subunit alcohol dehydrogenase family)
LILSDTTGVGAQLASQLSAAGEHAIVVYQGEKFDLNELLPAARGSAGHLLRGVVHLWSLDGSKDTELTVYGLEEAEANGCQSVVSLMQQLAEQTWQEVPRLWLVTRGAQRVGDDSHNIAIEQAPLWGLGRVISEEHADYWGGLLDLGGSDSTEQSASQICAELLHQDGEDQVALRNGSRYAARLMRAVAVEPSSDSGFNFRPDGSYLITGGLGDLGLLVARRIVEEGARRLILMGRTPVPPRSQWKRVEERQCCCASSRCHQGTGSGRRNYSSRGCGRRRRDATEEFLRRV